MFLNITVFETQTLQILRPPEHQGPSYDVNNKKVAHYMRGYKAPQPTATKYQQSRINPIFHLFRVSAY